MGTLGPSPVGHDWLLWRNESSSRYDDLKGYPSHNKSIVAGIYARAIPHSHELIGRKRYRFGDDIRFVLGIEFIDDPGQSRLADPSDGCAIPIAKQQD